VWRVKKEETTCIGNTVVVPLWGMLCGHPVDGNSGENPKRFNVKRNKTSTQNYFALRFLRKSQTSQAEQ
jgi:hypothetical protein